jgi:hypothetical protein
MNRQEEIASIIHRWEQVSHLHVKADYDVTEEEIRDIDDLMRTRDREEKIQELLLQDENLYRAASVFQDAEYDDLYGRDFDDDGMETMEARSDAYVELSLELVRLDAADIAIRLIAGFTYEIEGTIEHDFVMTKSVADDVVKKLTERGQIEAAWTFVESPQSKNHFGVEMALIIPSMTKSPIDLHRARRIVEREAERYWNHPEFGELLRTNAVYYWMDMWSLSGRDSDFENARRYCLKLDRESRAKGFLAIARHTWDADALASAFEAARLMKRDGDRAKEAHHIIMAISSHLHETDEPAVFKETIREVARRMTNPRWRNLLLKNTGLATRSCS